MRIDTMEKYDFELPGYERICICVHLDLKRQEHDFSSRPIDFDYRIYFLHHESTRQLKEYEHADKLVGPTQTHISGSFIPDTEEIKIENIQKGLIISGQKYTTRTVTQMIRCVPHVKSVFFANVKHKETSELLVTAKASKSTNFLNSCIKPGPLVGTLKELGFNNFEIVTQASCVGIRGYAE